ncbi:hypothetical protein FHS32_001592 [Streptomyces albaduncus]|uniref:Uncharacterized protein n=1 Tax=Streptomyces griseoloalbus TaxID=67303 RepID=A0A7W8BKE2_9ACTN|nr:hypothetical protein [Streptomyces albaduncus]
MAAADLRTAGRSRTLPGVAAASCPHDLQDGPR